MEWEREFRGVGCSCCLGCLVETVLHALVGEGAGRPRGSMRIGQGIDWMNDW